MKVLTLYPIWAWLIIHGPKRIENRTWATRHRGRLAIHAGKARTRPADRLEERAIREEMARQGIVVPDVLPSSCILGTVHLTDCVPLSQVAGQPFAEGPWCWLLDDVRALAEPIPSHGSQGLWTTDLL